VSERNVGGGSGVGDYLAGKALKYFVYFLIFLAIAAVLHSWSGGILP
jgi:hypothetical protein